MLHTTLLALARQRWPFAHFYRALTPALARVPPRRRMAVTASLWRATNNMTGARTVSQRAAYAKRLYKRQQQQQNRRSLVKQSHHGKPIARTVPQRSTALTNTTTAMPFDAFCKAVLQHGRARLTPRERAVLRRVYRSTSSAVTLQSADRLAVARSVLRALRQSYRPRAAAPRRRRHTLHTSRRSRPHRVTAPRHRAHRHRVGQSHPRRTAAGAHKAGLTSAFTAFRRKVLAQAKLTPTPEWDGRIYRMWLVLARRRGLSQARRVEAAVRLIPKLTRHGAARGPHTAVPLPAAMTAAASSSAQVASSASGKAGRAARKGRRAAGARPQTPPRRRNMYLTFYREMLLTGHVPNKPVKARTRRIKQLWRAVHHRKSLAERVSLAKQILAGTPIESTAASSPRRPARAAAVQAMARTSRLTRAPAAATAPSKTTRSTRSHVIRFAVPANYSTNPFAATYAVLNRYVKHKSANARMRAVARAWTRTQTQGADHRSPHARIKAVAHALQLKV